jgi:hypothetical protein
MFRIVDSKAPDFIGAFDFSIRKGHVAYLLPLDDAIGMMLFYHVTAIIQDVPATR